MIIEPREITIREVVNGYSDQNELGIVGYGGKLDIRPKYQREFVYKEKERNAVIQTILKGYPLNVMYWAVGSDGSLEVLDGQQRTISFCRYATNGFSVMVDGYPKTFNNLTVDQQNQILNYKLLVYFCEGTESEKLEWFRVVNIAGKALTEQELRNAAYTGPWLTHAKSIFSKVGGPAYQKSKDYIKSVEVDRQQLLERAIDWASDGKIEEYMSTHQHDHNANELWVHFRNIFDWVEMTFTVKRREMKGVDWAHLHSIYKDEMFNTAELEDRVKELMKDDEVERKSGIYPYVLTGEEKYLNLRQFREGEKRAQFERQNGICAMCNKQFQFHEMEADHIIPWSRGGKTDKDNCQVLCKKCNLRKSSIT